MWEADGRKGKERQGKERKGKARQGKARGRRSGAWCLTWGQVADTPRPCRERRRRKNNKLQRREKHTSEEKRGRKRGIGKREREMGRENVE